MSDEDTDASSDDAAIDRRELIAVVTLAAVIALAHLLQYLSLPFLQAPLYDSTVYLGQASALGDGDFGNATLVAFSPLYGYFLAVTGAPTALFPSVVAQLSIHVLIVAAIHRVGLLHLGRRAALASALLYIGYGIPLFYATKHLSETLGLALGFAFFGFYVSKGFRRGDLVRGVATGALVGLMVLARASLIFALPFVVLAAAFAWERIPQDRRIQSRRERYRRSAALIVGLALVLGANGLWNYRNTSFFVPVIMVSDTVRTSVAADVRGDLSAFSRRDDGGVSPWDVVDQAARRIEAGPKSDREAEGFDDFNATVLGDWMKGAPDKVLRTLSDLELTFYQYGYYGERQELSLLGATPVTFGALLLLSLVGAVALARRHGLRSLLPYFPIVAGVLCTTTLFHPTTRYRLALVIPTIFLAGFAVDTVSRLPSRKRLALAAPVLLTCLFFAWRTITYELHQPAVWELSVAESAALLPDAAEVARRVSRARALAGDDPGIQARIDYVEARLEPVRAPQ